MAAIRYRDDDSTSAGLLIGVAGAIAGFAVGVLVAQRMGGVSAITSRLRERFGMDALEDEEGYAADSAYDEEDELDTTLEERVLEAFRNDPILSERAVDIGAINGVTIELAGSVNTEEESDHATTVARGVPGVETVVNRLVVGDAEELADANARRVESGDPALTEARWEGQRVGTGRRRQGNSGEMDRHADPKPELEDRWLAEGEALRNAANEGEGMDAPRRGTKRAAKGDRTGGSPVAPTGVPKGDHVAEPGSVADTRGEKRAD